MLSAILLMIKRIIEISNPAYLHLKEKQLLISQEHEIKGQVPIEDIGALILEHSAIGITQPLIIACQQNNVLKSEHLYLQ